MRLAAESPAWLLPPSLSSLLLLTHQVWVLPLKTTSQRTHTHTHRCGTTDCPSFRLIPVFPSVIPVCRIYSPSICLSQGETRDVIVGDTNQSSWRRVGWLELIHSSGDWHKCPPCSFHRRKLRAFKGTGNCRTSGLTEGKWEILSQLLNCVTTEWDTICLETEHLRGINVSKYLARHSTEGCCSCRQSGKPLSWFIAKSKLPVVNPDLGMLNKKVD